MLWDLELEARIQRLIEARLAAQTNGGVQRSDDRPLDLFRIDTECRFEQDWMIYRLLDKVAKDNLVG